MVMVPKERDWGHRLSWQELIHCIQLREFSPAGKWLCWSCSFPAMGCSSPSDHQGCHQDTQWTGGKVFAWTRNVPSSLVLPLFLQTRKSWSQHSETYRLLSVSATLPGVHVLFPTLCVSFGKYMPSKGNQLGRDPKHLRKMMESICRPNTLFSKQRK